MTLLRAATAMMLLSRKVAPPSSDQFVPPSTERSRPIMRPLLKPPTRPLETLPMPATIVLFEVSLGSKARLEIDSEVCLSLSGRHVVPALVVIHTPPLLAPR